MDDDIFGRGWVGIIKVEKEGLGAEPLKQMRATE